MQTMIREYERSMELLESRIRSLNTELAENENLGNRERDTLLLRRDLLMSERRELVCDIAGMREYLKE